MKNIVTSFLTLVTLLMLFTGRASCLAPPDWDYPSQDRGCPPKLFLPTGNPAIPIEHIIVIVQENHSFDNYFGTYPGANGIPAGTRLPKVPNGPLVLAPFLATTTTPHDLGHSWLDAAVSYDNGLMDGFYWSAYARSAAYYGQGIVTPAADPNLVVIVPKTTTTTSTKLTNTTSNDTEIVSPQGFTDDEDELAPDVGSQNEALATKLATTSSSPPTQPSWAINALTYYDGTIIPNYWDYARHYTLCDNFFSSLRASSQPNHLYIVAAQSGGLATNYSPTLYTSYYFFPAITDKLIQAGVTWKHYSDQAPQTETRGNPLAGFVQIITNPVELANLVPTSQFYTDLKNQGLPQVCWLKPASPESEHPPNDITIGMRYVTHLVNAVMKSPYWNNCAIIITWDDYGGFYDHVPPVQTDKYGFGFRVPCLVISPYALPNTVVHTQYDFTSILKLIETKFHLSPLTERDNAANNMLDCFNFSQTPLPTDIIQKRQK
jgi:phospholipase C